MATRRSFLQVSKWLLAVLAADALFFVSVNPAATNSFMIILGCLMLGLTIYGALRLLGRAFVMLIPVTEATEKRLASFTAGLLMFLLLMQSIGQLSRRDVLAVVFLAVVLYAYLSYIASGNSTHTQRD